MQIRTMESQAPPVYVIAPGRVFRRDAVDATHLPVFHQVEGLAVDEGISFADLRGTLEAFAHAMFGQDVRVRLTPDYFPFVEPGCQAAVSCFVCGGVGCRVCGNGWIELLGAGMVHPNVLENVRLRPRAVHGVRVRHGDRARGDGPVRRPRHPAVRRGRRPVPRAVRGRGVKVVLSWLRELCPTDLSAEELAELLTSKGAEVEAIVRPWERLSGVVVARVIEVRDHPNSDTLCLARVQTGSGELEVVVGVRNMAPGDLVPLAPPGATVVPLPEPLGAREIRGVVSNGMLCAPDELGISASHDGILVLPNDLEPGADVAKAFGLDDAVLDIEVKPNRPDFLSVLGIAREVSAATGTPLSYPDTHVEEDPEPAEGVATLEVADLERCPRYLARVIRGVRHVPSPIAVQARLSAAGMRPISTVVDATNYAMLELGQPLHPFDLALLKGPASWSAAPERGRRW